MYLKQIEITGFKSFADKTRLQFEPGMIAIVGPNGCGKSNVSDAIRWVLGEQRPTALRCARMPDLVFNGTDTRKPLGMAEVSITFAECEGVLDTEFNEVTIARRVFRSGEGQYFINKNLCRLRDIQRLFMGTGIGTTSYSVMAQGQIDAILSSRPEDRRAVFEEAAGITKFKADRKDALRKIDQTEANLLRLTDVIREVKRQINTLQRQAGKAQRYRELRDSLRGLDIFLTRRRLAELDVRLRALEESIRELTERFEVQQAGVEDGEGESARIHAVMHEIEAEIATLAEQAAQADNRYIRAQEVMRVNEQRIAEYHAWAERDEREIAETGQQIEQIEMQLESLAQKRVLVQQAATVERDKLEEAQARFDAHRARIEETRGELQQGRQQVVESERRSAQIQSTLARIEEAQREQLMRHDRLTAEAAQLEEGLAGLVESREEIEQRRRGFGEAAEGAELRFEVLEQERDGCRDEVRELQGELSELSSEAAACRAQLELLRDQDESSTEFSAGAQLLLDSSNPLGLAEGVVAGPLAEGFDVPQGLRLAVEAALRAWMDAVVVSESGSVREVLGLLLARGGQAAVRVASGGIPANSESSELELPSGVTPLLDHLKVEGEVRGAAEAVLGRVLLAGSLAEVPADLPDGYSVVTREGVMLHANGCGELWMPESQVSSPLARRMLISDASEKLEGVAECKQGIRQELERVEVRLQELGLQLSQSRRELDESRRKGAQADGEYRTVARDIERGEARLDNLKCELEGITLDGEGVQSERGELVRELQGLTSRRDELLERGSEMAVVLQELESEYGDLSHALTECRIQVSTFNQQLEHAAQQSDDLQQRVDELTRTVEGRRRGVLSYNESIGKLKLEIEELEANLEPMRLAAEELHGRIEQARVSRGVQQRELEVADARLSELRRALDASRDDKTRAEIEVAESRLRRENLLEHIYDEYGLASDELVSHPDPAWEGGTPPPLPEVEERVAALNASIQALGPVNLVAIEEYKELEERYTFLKAQESDLQKSKQQILELIAMINEKSSEMFKTTFEQANANFQRMFTKLFNGGEAQLRLLENSEDPLECGVDIIARPPGKRPQSVTLLSGGERTMTAVSLLFAIFMIKPAPFCMLDELDAALDDSNIGRFVQALREFLTHSQFLIITHNQHTIAASDIVYGVTQQDKGVSKVVSMRLHEVGSGVAATEVSGE